MKLVKYVKQYEMIPTGYRIAWMDFYRHQGVCFPLGIHWLAMLIRRVWIWTYRWPRPDWLESRDMEMYRKGVAAEREYQERIRRHERCDYRTKEELYKEGYDAGWNAYRLYRKVRDQVEGLGKKEDGHGDVQAAREDGPAERGIQPERGGVEQASPDSQGDR